MTNDRPYNVLFRHQVLADVVGDLGPHATLVPGWADLDEVLDAKGTEIDILVIGGTEPVDAALLDRLPNLRLICCFGAGFDAVDLAAVQARHIPITVAAGLNAPDVADLAVGMLLYLICGFGPGQAYVQADRWRRDGGTPVRRSVAHHRIGLVGLGAIGQAIATRLAPFGTPVSWWAPNPNPQTPLPRATSLAALAAKSDAIVVCCRADAANHHMIDAGFLAAMRPGSYLVNIARGSLVDEHALRAALASFHLGGAALDVFDPEPTAAADWATTPNILLSPHRAGLVDGALARQADRLRDNFARLRAGQPMPNLVT